jgi:hypothetical protein
MKIFNHLFLATTALVAASTTTMSTMVHVNVTVDDQGITRIPIRPFTRSRDAAVIDAFAVLDFEGN